MNKNEAQAQMVYYVGGIISDHEGEDPSSVKIFRAFEDTAQYQTDLENEGHHEYVSLKEMELN